MEGDIGRLASIGTAYSAGPPRPSIFERHTWTNADAASAAHAGKKTHAEWRVTYATGEAHCCSAIRKDALMKVYIAGRITGDKNYREKFMDEEINLMSQGHHVMNPAILPDGFEYHEYLRICKAMLRACDVVVFLPDWHSSRGARIERQWAEKHRKKIILKEGVRYESEFGETVGWLCG